MTTSYSEASPEPGDRVLPLFTDLYELTMAAGYLAHGVTGTATFSVYIRGAGLPRGFLVAAGLAPALAELEDFRFRRADINYLEQTGIFPRAFLDRLPQVRFTGTVRAMPEGTIFFPDEPLLEVTAPILEAQLLETFVLNAVGLQTMLASKAARCMLVAGGRPLVDFALRRTQGQDAGMAFARACHIVGFAATSNVRAGRAYGIPVSGTMAHSFVTAFADEEAAFRAYAEVFPDSSVFLIDTYDTVSGARIAARVGKDMAARGYRLQGVRLDSGDMVALSRQVRAILDEAGLPEVKIFASSGFDEFKIADALAAGATIDAFGVGTKAGVSADMPFLDIVYKMVVFQGRPIHKRSPGKETLGGEKQVFRRTDGDGRFAGDILGTADEHVEGAQPLLEAVMTDGRICTPSPSLEAIRQHCRRQLAGLDEGYRRIRSPAAYPVQVSERLRALQQGLP
jgi:nicotinate phosphoribosyltransferase